VQSAVDREPTTVGLVEWEGIGTVESWTTPFDRDGQPEKAFLAVRTPDAQRVLAVLTDAAAVQATVHDDIAGAKVAIASDGTATLR
jgi:acetyl-CoA C-acetyltransferase